MAIKSIVVHLDGTTACRQRLRAAVQLAKPQRDTMLTGLHVLPSYYMPLYGDSYTAPQLIQACREAMLERAAEIQRDCKAVMQAAGLSMTTHVEEGLPVSVFNQYARYADLLILGRDDPEDLGGPVAEHVIIGSGTPSLVMPLDAGSNGFTQRILIAWDGSRESARAVRDALPILKPARHVEVLSIETDSGHTDTDDAKPSIHDYLAGHGIEAEIHICQGKNIGAVIRSHAADIGAGMIVAGAYGHSRLRELVLGGVTRDLLKHSTVPLFMSH